MALGTRNLAFFSPENLEVLSDLLKDGPGIGDKRLKLFLDPIVDRMLYLVGAGLGLSYFCKRKTALLLRSPAKRESRLAVPKVEWCPFPIPDLISYCPGAGDSFTNLGSRNTALEDFACMNVLFLSPLKSGPPVSPIVDLML